MAFIIVLKKYISGVIEMDRPAICQCGHSIFMHSKRTGECLFEYDGYNGVMNICFCRKFKDIREVLEMDKKEDEKIRQINRGDVEVFRRNEMLDWFKHAKK